jgi:hypothetical protein
MAKAKMAIESSISEDIKIEDYLQRVDLLVRGKALADALKAASKIVQKDAQARIPRSDRTGTSKKKSKKQRDRDMLRKPLADSIAIKMVSKNDGMLHMAITGQKLEPHMKGKDRKNTTAHGHLLEFGHKAYFWSDKPATRKTFVEAKRWLAPAVDSTQIQQNQAVISSLEKSIRSSR